jgi:tetratricopeptide (TPR) repeat protein
MSRILCCLLILLAPAANLSVVSAQAGQVPTGGAPPDSTPETRAQGLLKAGKIDAAIEQLKAQSEAKPADPQINYSLGLAYYLKKDYARAVEPLRVAAGSYLKDRAERRHAVQMLALSHFLLGHAVEAIPYLEEVSIWAPENVEINYALGLSYVHTHQVSKSRAAFSRMFKLPAESAAAHLINAQMLIRQRYEEYAEKELLLALALEPKLPQANFLLGELAIYRAKIDLGIEYLQKEIVINPAFGMAYYRLGEALTRQLKWDEAVAPLQKSIWLNPYFSGPYIVLGKVYLKKSDLGNAESMLRRALQMDPNNFSGHHLLAQVLQQANRPEEARKEFETAERLRANADQNR